MEGDNNMGNMKKIASILVLILMLGIVSISGCTSSDNTQPSVNDTNASYAATSEPATNSSVDTNVTDTSSSSDYSSSSDSSSSSSTSSSDSGTYIGNANTHVFHYASCYHVDAMKDSNKVYFSSAKAAEDAGYRPCKDCNP